MVARPSSEFLLRTRWYIRLRWFLISAITLPSLVSLWLGSGLRGQRVSSLVFTVAVLASNLVFYGLSRRPGSTRYYRRLATLILAFDVAFITYFIYSKGGIESRSQLVYALPILISSALFGRRGVYVTALVSAFGYDAVIFGNYLGFIHSPEQLTNQATNVTYVLNTVIFFTALLVLVAVLADFLTRLLVEKEREATATATALRRAQAIAKLGSWEWDMANDTITWSDELYRIFGVTPGKTMDYQSFIKYIHPEDREWTATTISRSLKTRRPFSFENRIVRPDKQVRILHGEGKVLTDKHGKLAQLYGIAQDITAERALEAAKGDFVSLASHQLRTPASGVRMLLAMLRDGYTGTLTPEQSRAVGEAYDANERLLRIADDLLNVAKLESGRLVLNKRQIELCFWLKTLLAPQKLLVRQQRQKMRLILPKGPVPLHGDPERLAMVLDNLLSNALKYTPQNGTIRVVLQPGRKAHKIIVSDTGSGMTKSEVNSLFGKFTRLDNAASKGTEGTGLGLYLAKSIVDLHQGNIKVSSKPGIGSTFTVTIPVTVP